MMYLGEYQLLEQLGAIPDGVRFRGVDRTSGTAVEIINLAAARNNEARFVQIQKRLRTASLIEHPSARRILTLNLEHTPPFVVLEAVSGPRVSDLSRSTAEDAITLCATLAEALLAGHRLGMAQGRLSLTTIRARADGVWTLDWTGLDGNVECDTHEDIRALGILLHERCTGELTATPDWSSLDDPWVVELGRSMTAANPLARPSASALARRFAAMLQSVVATGAFQLTTRDDLAMTSGLGLPQSLVGAMTRIAPPSSVSSIEDRASLGRFLLKNKLGEGGMGTVFRAIDQGDGSTVAIKVLGSSWSERPEALARFLKEARMLAEVNNPYVTNFIELNEDQGIHYLALEFVEGENLGDVLVRQTRLDEPTALAIMIDVACGLAPVHERGIVHRDIKPANILIQTDENGLMRGKLTDFGLAKHVDQSDSLQMTQAGTLLGTPLYMAPEQCMGEEPIDARADVYAMGATLFHLLAGRPPFLAQTPIGLISAHQNETPLHLKSFNPSLSDGISQVVAKALAKQAEARYLNAGELLDDLERLARGEPTGIAVHPALPDDTVVFAMNFSWDLEATPRQLWPHVSNTERLNRAAGFSPVKYATQAKDGGGSNRFGAFKVKGIAIAWQENPFEWVEARKMGVLREYTSGPFKWLASIVELEAKAGGGTTLTHRFRICPNGLLGRTVAHLEIARNARKALEGVYRRIDAALMGKLGEVALVDPFEAAPELSRERKARLERLLDALVRHGIEVGTVEAFGTFLTRAPAQEVSRIRPLALARRLKLPPDQVVAACLHGAVEGGLMLLWDLLCPVCRVPSQVLDTLKALRDHGHCDACALDYDLDFANSVELIFRVHPELRETDVATYCLGGPAHMPHVAAQARVAPGERLVLEPALPEGRYRLRGPQLAWSFDLRIESGATVPRRLEIDLGQGLDRGLPRVLQSGRQVIVLTNSTSHELLVRLERVAARDDALTAGRASALALFRELFPGEILSPGQLVNLASVTLLITELDAQEDLYAKLGDAKAFALVHEHFRRIEAVLRTEGGALVKTVHEGVVAAFAEPLAAVRAALVLGQSLTGGSITKDFGLKVGVHHGPAMVATFNDHLDYFGSTVRLAASLPRLASAGEVILTPSVASDPEVAAYLDSQSIQAPIESAILPGLADGFIHRLVARRQNLAE